jgi:hypothetical protein
MIDGIYCLATDKFRTFAFIERVFASLANVLIEESKNQHRFMVRGAVAYGPVVRGEDLSDGSRYLTGHAAHSSFYTDREVRVLRKHNPRLFD